MNRLRFLALALALFGLIAFAVPAQTCPFCTAERGSTMIDDYAKASLVIYGTFNNARLKNGFAGEGETDFEIETVLKSHPLLKGVKKVTVPQYKNHPKIKFVLFCDVYKGRIDAFRADAISEGSELVNYFQGAVKVKDRPLTERLLYCFPYLNSPEFEVSLDAYREFANADSSTKEYRDMAGKLDPKVLVDWLSDSKTPPYRFGLYSSLLGHCGKGPKYGEFLHKLIEDTDRHKGSGIDGMMVGYIMIQPKEGWGYVEKDVLANPKTDFQTRYAALRAIRFLWAQGADPALVDKKALVHGMMEAAEFPDIADFAIEDLRKWRTWEMTDAILKLASRKSHQVGVIQRATLRFMLQSPAKSAAAYVTAQRKRDPEQVRDTEEILKLEPDPAPPTTGTAK
jgi:hypothetical protein